MSGHVRKCKCILMLPNEIQYDRVIRLMLFNTGLYWLDQKSKICCIVQFGWVIYNLRIFWYSLLNTMLFAIQITKGVFATTFGFKSFNQFEEICKKNENVAYSCRNIMSLEAGGTNHNDIVGWTLRFGKTWGDWKYPMSVSVACKSTMLVNDETQISIQYECINGR